MIGRMNSASAGDEARLSVAELERRLLLMPSSFDVVRDLAAAFFHLGRAEDALDLFVRAHSISRRSGVALDVAVCLNDLGRFDEADVWIARALDSAGENREPRLCLGLAESLLRRGRYREGWPWLEKGRLSKREAQLQARIPETMPEWQGETIDSPLLVLGEGGVGDRLCFSRLLPIVTARGVTYQCRIDHGYPPGRGPLGHMFETLSWVDRPSVADARREPTLASYSHWTTTFALMAALNLDAAAIPPATPWHVAEALVNEFRLPADPRPTVGLAWSSAEVKRGRRLRSLSEWQASYLVARTARAVRWLNLQYDFVAPCGASNCHRLLTWEDTAAAIASCDAVVTVDTGVMHLASALGKTVWVLLSGHSDWKFGVNGQCVWYKEARLFRNGAAPGFDNALDAVIAALDDGELAARPS